MSDLPDNYDPQDDLDTIAEMLRTERAVFEAWVRYRYYTIRLQVKIATLILRLYEAESDVP